MTDYITKSFHDLLVGDSEVISNSNSSRGSHHPSRECFMADTLEGHIKSVNDGGLLPLLTPITRSREMQESCLTYGWTS
jgi:hypothetical protein